MLISNITYIAILLSKYVFLSTTPKASFAVQWIFRFNTLWWSPHRKTLIYFGFPEIEWSQTEHFQSWSSRSILEIFRPFHLFLSFLSYSTSAYGNVLYIQN